VVAVGGTSVKLTATGTRSTSGNCTGFGVSTAIVTESSNG